MSQRAVVVGGGAIGIASAFYLSQSGWQVTVIDSGEIGRGCSYGNACLIVPSHSHPLPAPGVMGEGLRFMLKKDSPFYIKPRFAPDLMVWAWNFWRHCNAEAYERGSRAMAELSRASLDLFEELSRSHDFFYQRKGLLHVYLTDKGAEAAVTERDQLAAHGLPARVLSQKETLELEPALSDRIRGGLFIEGDAHGFSYGYVRALADALETRGATLLTERPVKGVLVERGAVKGVLADSPREEIAADLVVLAAGSWTPSLAKSLDLRIPLQPAKGYSSTIDAYPGCPAVPILIPETRVIVTPLAERLRFGGTLELAGLDLSLDEARYQAVVRAGREVLRESFEMKNEEAWCGLRPFLPDGLPIIDKAPGIEGLIVATGHAMLGFTQSPITGKLVAELADGKAPSVPVDAYRFDRF
jgi:D-amino-acid dehydrogenase